LVLGNDHLDFIFLDEALKHLEKRCAVLGGAVLSGGEPTLYEELPELIQRIKKLGLAVKIDTNGMEPAMLERLLDAEETAPDYIALDLKVAPWRYAFLGHTCEDPENMLAASAGLIRDAGIPHEFRTLVFPHKFVTPEDIESLAFLVDDAPWYFRIFRPGNCLDPAWNNLNAAEFRDAETLAKYAQALGKRGMCPL
jgi:pyruvate formate lyase activating enzyme